MNIKFSWINTIMTVVKRAQLTSSTISRMVPKRAESVRKKVNNVSVLTIYLFNSQLYCKLPIHVCMFYKVQTTAHFVKPSSRADLDCSFQSSENDTHILSCLGTHAFVWYHSVDCIYLYILREHFVDP